MHLTMARKIFPLKARKFLVGIPLFMVHLDEGLFGVDHLTDPSGFKSTLDECYSNCHMLIYEAKDPNRKRMMVQVVIFYVHYS